MLGAVRGKRHEAAGSPALGLATGFPGARAIRQAVLSWLHTGQMTLLDDIISGATEDSVSTSNLLRKVQVVAHRLEAAEITAWVHSELNGYTDKNALPTVRKDLSTPVSGIWAGIMGSQATLNLSAGSMPEESAKALFTTSVFQSISELEELAELPSDPGQPWDPLAVRAYNQWVEQDVVPGMEMMNLVAARRVLTRAAIRGIINSARNTALDFALQLQSTSPDAGEQNGPTVAEAPIAATIYNIHNTITGHGTNIAAGANAHLRSSVIVNDLGSLLAAVKELGLDDSAATELASAVIAPEAERPSKVAAFLTKVRDGAFVVGTSASGQVIADQLTPLINAYLGI